MRMLKSKVCLLQKKNIYKNDKKIQSHRVSTEVSEKSLLYTEKISFYVLIFSKYQKATFQHISQKIFHIFTYN